MSYLAIIMDVSFCSQETFREIRMTRPDGQIQNFLLPKHSVKQYKNIILRQIEARGIQNRARNSVKAVKILIRVIESPGDCHIKSGEKRLTLS